MSRFDTVINRKGTGSTKWDYQGGDALPLWVADMDFASPEPIIESMRRRLEHPVFGYTRPEPELNDVIVEYYRRSYGFEISPEWLVWLPNVNAAVNVACRTAPGDLMISTPIYSHIFLKLADESRKRRIAVPLKEQDGYYSFNFEAMEQTAQAEKPGVFVLCNPHNPVGRSYTRAELEQIADFAERQNLLVVADEIHSDLVWGAAHTPFFTLGERVWKRSITLHSASKTYNLPGVPMGFAVIPDAGVRARFAKEAYGLFPGSSVFAIAAYRAAFTECEAWRQELLEYLRGNDRYLRERIARIPQLRIARSEATYLGWVDARGTGLENPWRFFREHAGVHFGNGADFGAEGFIRVNYGCPRSILEQAFDRVERALDAR